MSLWKYLNIIIYLWFYVVILCFLCLCVFFVYSSHFVSLLSLYFVCVCHTLLKHIWFDLMWFQPYWCCSWSMHSSTAQTLPQPSTMLSSLSAIYLPSLVLCCQTDGWASSGRHFLFRCSIFRLIFWVNKGDILPIVLTVCERLLHHS